MPVPEIVLSGEERGELEHVAACYARPHKEVQRAKLVLYAAEGLTNVEIGRRLELSPIVVGRWRRRFHRERVEGLKDRPRSGRPRRFPPPQEVAQVKAIACELPRSQGVPLSHFSGAELHRLVVERGVSEASATTILRGLAEDAIKAVAAALVDLPLGSAVLGAGGSGARPLRGRWEGKLLHPGDLVISRMRSPRSRRGRASTRPRRRDPVTASWSSTPTSRWAPSPTSPRSTSTVAATARRACSDARSAAGRIEPFDRLVWQVMTSEPYASARRVFWIVDNGSSHRGQASVDRLQRRWPSLILVHLPIHASWLNQIEIYFSIVQRKLLKPNDFDNLAEVARTLNQFEHRWNQVAQRSSPAKTSPTCSRASRNASASYSSPRDPTELPVATTKGEGGAWTPTARSPCRIDFAVAHATPLWQPYPSPELVAAGQISSIFDDSRTIKRVRGRLDPVHRRRPLWPPCFPEILSETRRAQRSTAGCPAAAI